MTHSRITAFVLAKNEEANIAACLQALHALDVPVVLLDSGSTDDTVKIASCFAGVETWNYPYTTHANAYNFITAQTVSSEGWAVVLDADMRISAALWSEVLDLCRDPQTRVLRAPIRMFVEGGPLQHGSLCPPKAFVFRGGENYFEPSGHGERLLAGAAAKLTREPLDHDDRKDYRAYLMSQARYAATFAERSKAGHLSRRDRLRRALPVLAALVPLYSLFVKGGLLSGKRGILYAIDRCIAELIMYRQALASRLR